MNKVIPMAAGINVETDGEVFWVTFKGDTVSMAHDMFAAMQDATAAIDTVLRGEDPREYVYVEADARYL